jgi:nicotinamidase-related amidase
MPTTLSFDIARTAVLAMDCQAVIVSIYAKPPEEFLARASSLLEAARRVGMAVIHVQMGFRPGLPEVSGRNKLLAASSRPPTIRRCLKVRRAPSTPRSGPSPATSSSPNIA